MIWMIFDIENSLWKSNFSTLRWAGKASVSFFGQCSKMQLIPLQNFIIKTCFI